MPQIKFTHKSGAIIKAVLFDLDGTLLDTAPDILEAINSTLREFGHRETDLQSVSEGISHGAVGIFQQLLGSSNPHQHQVLLTHFLTAYQGEYPGTQAFPGIIQLLAYLQKTNIVWGVVTNKSSRFTLPILKKMALAPQASCIVSGDSTAHRKPHPAPVLLACEQLGLLPHKVLFLGDHEKDIVAGQAAGTYTAFAKYGYIDSELKNSGNFSSAATYTIEHPMQLAIILDQLNEDTP